MDYEFKLCSDGEWRCPYTCCGLCLPRHMHNAGVDMLFDVGNSFETVRYSERDTVYNDVIQTHALYPGTLLHVYRRDGEWFVDRTESCDATRLGHNDRCPFRNYSHGV